ncbi:uncharacterized protein LOC131530204 [Onychostoma macrolepis]|uniref:uncharacterized protein LOC131530204 n=1 Tax=Onychostoma macrolepis TaxID=369639 RepID=UPI0027299A0C|nr:uncharacterized protein LOC131530204 [Onychostoma macrolepis]
MFHMLVLFCLCWWHLIGVFGESVSVMEGDSVTLKTNATEVQQADDILWKFGAEKSLIAKIKKPQQIFSTFNGTDGRFRDRLKLDNQTGFLTITNITTQHAGLYKLDITGEKLSSHTFDVSVYAHLPVPVISRNSLQCSSSSSPSCSLLCSVVNVGHVTLSWYKGNSLLSSISVSDLSISLSLPLEVEYQDNNTYSCVLNNPISNQTQHLNVTHLCQKCAGVFGESVSVMEGDSVTLNTDVTEIHEDDDILWKFGAEKSQIAKMKKKKQIFSTYDGPDGRFRDRLKLDNQTGSLTITNITTQHAGVYQLEIAGAKKSSQTFSVSVYARLPFPVISSNSSQCSSSSSSQQNCSLLCSVVNVSHVTLSWYKGNRLLSSISVSDLSISLSLPLEVEYQDKNTYSCVLNNPISNQTTHLDISRLCNTCAVSVSLIALISVGSLVIVAAVGIFWICKKCRKIDKEDEAETGSESEGEPTEHQLNQTGTDETAPESSQQSKGDGLGTEPETENVQIEKERQYNETEREETEVEQEDMESEAATDTKEKEPED